MNADAAATELGFPVAVKIVSPDIEHKCDMGGVALGLLAGSQLRGCAYPVGRTRSGVVPASRSAVNETSVYSLDSA